MEIAEAQREIRTRFAGGFYGQLVSGILWLVSAGLATWSLPRHAIAFLVIGGFFIFPLTELLLRVADGRSTLSPGNTLHQLGMQVAFVLPLSMLLLAPLAAQNRDLFYPALTILLGAHYLPFCFLYGMRMFALLSAILVVEGTAIALYAPRSFSLSAWCTGAALLAFAFAGRAVARRDRSGSRIV